MASLTLPELRKREGRIETFVSMMKHKIPFQMVNGDQKIITRIGFTDRSGRITEFVPGRDIRQYNETIEWLRKKASSGGTVILMSEKERFSLKEVMKTSDFGGTAGKGNRGDMAEAIFAIAITCRFINKNTTVSEPDVIKVINTIDPLRQKQQFIYDSPNKDKNIVDKVIFTLHLSPSNLSALTDDTALVALKNLIQSSVTYANSQSVTKWAKELYENNMFNKIDVQAIGTLKQKETKVDVQVLIDDKEVDINVSLKAEEVKQFGQVYGSGFEKQEILWKSLFGIDPSGFKKDYYNKLSDTKDHISAIAEVYKGMADLITTNLKTRKQKTYESISKGVKYYATYNQQNVTLVQLTKNEAVVYDFNNLSLLLSTTQLQAKYISHKATPEISLVDTRGKALFNVRCRRDGNKIRNVIEKGPLLTELSSYTIA